MKAVGLVRDDRVRLLVEAALSVALAAVLGSIKITLPWNIAGGSVSLSMLPLFVLAMRRGVWWGIAAGGLYGFVDYLMEPFFVHWAQVLLDYPIAFGACGLAGTVRRLRSTGAGAAAASQRALAGALVGGAGRLAAHFVSGVIFFGQNAPEGQPVWLYSLLYNASYLLPSVIACALAAALIVPALARAVPDDRSTTGGILTG